jgi:hypothetical protein
MSNGSVKALRPATISARPADQIEGGEVLIHADRIEHRQDRHTAGQPDPAGTRGRGGQHHSGCGHREIQRVMLAQGEDVQTGPVGERGVPNDVGDALLVGHWSSGHRGGLYVAERDHAELHEGRPCRRSRG